MPVQPLPKEMEAEGDSAAEMNGEEESEDEHSGSQSESEEESSGSCRERKGPDPFFGSYLFCAEDPHAQFPSSNPTTCS